MANPIQRLWSVVRTGLAAVPSRLSRRKIAHARGLEPGLSWEFDFSLQEDGEEVFLTNWLGRRVPPERLEIVASDLDRLLAHIHDPDSGIPDDVSRSGRSPWGGQAFEMQDPQFSGAIIDVNLSRRFGVVEVDIPTGASEQPVRQTIRELERFADVIRRMLALREERVAGGPVQQA